MPFEPLPHPAHLQRVQAALAVAPKAVQLLGGVQISSAALALAVLAGLLLLHGSPLGWVVE